MRWLITALSAIALFAFVLPIRAETLGVEALRSRAEAVAASVEVETMLGGARTVRTVERVDFPGGPLYVASFSPSGHAVLTPSTRLGVLLRLSDGEFAFPDADSPSYAILDSVAAEAVRVEAEGEAPSPRSRIATQAVPSYSYIPPITLTCWNQKGAVNWFAPGESPGGCTAVAYAQIMRAMEWPVWIGETVSNSLGYNYADYETYSLHPYSKIDYSKMTEKAYWNIDRADQSLEIARSILLVDIVADMKFSPSGSGAWVAAAANNPWYEPAVVATKGGATSGAAYENFMITLHQAAVEGIPVCAEIQSSAGYHAVMLSGWSGSSGSEKAYFNFGWGGTYGGDGWYSLNIVYPTLNGVNRFYLSRPKKTVQIAPLRGRSDVRPTLEWALPACYTNKVSGFTVRISRSATDESALATVGTDVVNNPQARTWTPAAPLDDGCLYSFAITPNFIDPSVTPLESSPVTTRIVAGSDMSPRTVTVASLDNVATDNMKMKDGALREATLNGLSVIRVTAPKTTVALEVLPYRPDTFPASSFAVYPRGAGVFDVVHDASAILDHTENARILYTVCAEDADGSISAKDFILYYTASTARAEGESYAAPAAKVASALSDGTSVAVPREWILSRFPQVADGEWPALLADDADGDGYSNAAEYILGTDPKDAADRLRITGITLENGLPVVTYEPTANPGVANFVLQGSSKPNGPWKTHSGFSMTHRFFRVVVTPVE